MIGLYGMIGYAGLRTAKLARDLHSKLLAAGITSLILCQATLNFFAVLGMAPLTGVPLPFLSYGSTNLIVLMGAMGLLLNVAATGGRAARGRRPGRAWRRSTEDAMPRIVIAAGGTAGHVVPALAVADALRARGRRGRVRRRRARRGRAGARGRLPVPRAAGARARPPQPAAAPRAPGCWRRPGDAAGPQLLRELGADAVLGRRRLRGRARWASRRAALRLPLVLTEADSHLGVTNRLLAPLARAGLPGLPDRGPRRARSGVRERPAACRPAPAAPTARRRARASASAPDEPCVLVFGGSLGARRLNDAALDAFGAAAPVRRAARQRAARPRRACARASTRSARRPTTTCMPYIEPFADALAAADLVVARAGGSVIELAAAGLPAILVPYPHATADHQTSNARYIERAGAARGGARRRARRPAPGARGGRAAGRAAAHWRRWPSAARAVARPDAAERIAAELLALTARE